MQLPRGHRPSQPNSCPIVWRLALTFAKLALLPAACLLPRAAVAQPSAMHLASLLLSSADAAAVDVAISPNSLAADYSQVATIVVTVTDVNGAPLPGKPVAMAVSGFGNSINTGGGTTDGSGQYTMRLKSFGAQLKVITATSGKAKNYATVVYVPGPPDPQATSLTILPRSGLAADGRSPCLISAIVVDAYRNRIAGLPVALTSTGSNNVIDSPNGITSASGTYFATLITSKAETKTVTIAAGAASTSATVMFVGGEPNLQMTSLAIAPDPGPIAGDGNDAYFVVTTVRDAFGNPVSALPVALSSSGLAGRFEAAEGVTGTDGIYATKFRATESGNAIIYAAAGLFSTTATVGFVVGVPTNKFTNLAVVPSSVVANDNDLATLTLTACDNAGNPAPGQAVTLSATGSANTLQATGGVTDGNGTFVTTLKSSRAENKVISYRVGRAANRGYANFVAGPADANLSTFSVNPNVPVAADRSGTFLLRATVVDSFLNPVKGAPVAFASSDSNDIFSAVSINTSPFGVATGLLRSTDVGSRTITLMAGGLTLTTAANFSLGMLSGRASSFVATPAAGIVADGNDVAVLAANLHDSVGHPLANQNVTVTSSGPGDLVGGLPGIIGGVTDANGYFSTTLSATRAEKKTVRIEQNGLRMTLIVPFAPGPPVAANAQLHILPANVPADSRTSAQLTVDVEDAYHNGCYGQTVNVAVSGGNNQIGQAVGTTGSSGSFATTVRSSLAEVKQVTATVGNITLQGNVNFVAGLAFTATSSFVVSPNSNLLADRIAAADVNVSVNDNFGNPLSGVKVYFTSNLSGSVFSPRTGLLDATGSIQSTMTSSSAGSTKVMLQVGPITLSMPVTFIAGSPNAYHSTFVATPPGGIAANNVAYATLNAVVRDRYDNPVSNLPLTLSSTDPCDTFPATSGTTDGRGVFSTKVRSTRTGHKTLTLAGGNIALSTNVAFMPGAANVTLSTLTVSATTAPADNVSTVLLQASLRDDYGNIIPGLYVSFSSSSSRNLFVPVGGATNASGNISTAWRTSGAGSKIANMTSGTFIMSTPAVTFTPGSPNQTISRLALSPSYNVPANGNATSTITATVLDVFANPLPGQPITFSSTGTTDFIAAPSGTTGANGAYATTIKSTTAGSTTVTFVSNGLSKQGNITFVTASSSRLPPADLFRFASLLSPALEVEEGAGPAAPGRPSGSALGAGGMRQAKAIGPVRPPNCARATSCRWRADGLYDLVLQAGEQGNVLWRAALTTGGHAAPIPLDLGFAAGQIVCADLDGDGLAELIASDDAHKRLFALGWQGDGASAPTLLAAPRSLPAAATTLAAADLDGDGLEDVVLTSAAGLGLVYGARGSDMWSDYQRIEGGPCVAARAVDLDGDGLLDVAWLPEADGDVRQLRNFGRRMFAAFTDEVPAVEIVLPPPCAIDPGP